MNKKYSLDKFMGGAVAERFSEELQKVIDNIMDPNTKETAKRGIAINFDFTPDEDRNMANMAMEVKSKLAGVRAVNGKMEFGRDYKTGQAIGEEYGRSADRDQVELDVTEDGETIIDTKGDLGGLKLLNGSK